ncbi:MAG: PEP-CTERM sorting domain-containing protein [Bryobacteraceae bacterium]
MRKLLSAAFLLTLCLGVTPAMRASMDEIVLGGADQAVTFLSNGNNLLVNLGACANGTCTLSGDLAFGQGKFAVGGAGPWSITSQENTISVTPDGTGLWLLNSPDIVTFSFGNGGALLTGNLNLQTVVQVPNTLTAVFDHNSNTLTNLGGSLAPLFGPAGGIIDWTVAFNGGTDLSTLLSQTQGGARQISGVMSSGEIVPTPEPGSLVLIGSGLVLAGGLLRKRNAAAKA